MKPEDIAFIIFAAIMAFLLIKEFIPESIKKYWGYQWQLKKDQKAGCKGRYSFTWRRR